MKFARSIKKKLHDGKFKPIFGIRNVEQSWIGIIKQIFPLSYIAINARNLRKPFQLFLNLLCGSEFVMQFGNELQCMTKHVGACHFTIGLSAKDLRKEVPVFRSQLLSSTECCHASSFKY